MKGILKIGIMLLGMVAYTTLSAQDGRESKILSKHKTVIENAAPDDWKTLAKSADACLKKNVNTREIASWIDRSLEIKKTAYNLEVKGDYYMANNLPEKAGEYYLEAIENGMSNDPDFDSSELQEKIAEII